MESALATYGKVNYVISSIIVTLVSIVMIGVAIHLLTRPVRKASVEGVVKSYDPNTKNISVEYVVNNVKYYLTTAGNTGVGGTVVVLYDSNNPSYSRLDTQMSNKAVASIIIVTTLVVMTITYVSAYFAFKSKSFAAISGGLDLAGNVGSILRN